MRRLEYWPDYGGKLLWSEDGASDDLDSLDLPEALRHDTAHWLEGFDDAKLPLESTHDDDWLAEGQRLYAALRLALEDLDIELVTTEEQWL